MKISCVAQCTNEIKPWRFLENFYGTKIIKLSNLTGLAYNKNNKEKKHIAYTNKKFIDNIIKNIRKIEMCHNS